MTIVRLPHTARRSQIAQVMNNFAIAGLGDNPVLNLDFTDASMDLAGRGITFTRASSATRVNASGLIELVGNNIPRRDYDPIGLYNRGLLIEESRTNLCLSSEDCRSNGNGNPVSWWINTAETATLDQIGVRGTANTATLITEDASNTSNLFCPTSMVISAGATVTATVYIKRVANLSWFRILLWDAVIGGAGWFNLSTGTAGSTVARSTGSGMSSSISLGPNGFYKCVFTVTLTGSASTLCNVNIISADADASNTRSANATFVVGAVQVEVGAFPTSYIPTTSASVTRAADVASMTGTNFSSWFNATEGTFVAQYARSQAVVVDQPFTVSDTTLNNRVQIQCITSGATSAVYRYNATNADTGNTSVSVPTGNTIKTAVGYSTGAILGLSTAGSAVINSATFGAWGTAPNTLYLGANAMGIVTPEVHIQRLTYYNKRLPDATLQALSA